METLLFNEDFDNNLIDNNDDEYRRDDDMWALSRLPEKCFGAMSRRRRFEMHGYDYIERSVTLMCFLCVAGGVWVAVGGPSPVRRGPRYCPADPPTHPRFPFLSSIVSECAVCVSVSIVVASPIFSLRAQISTQFACVGFCETFLKCTTRVHFFLLTDRIFSFFNNTARFRLFVSFTDMIVDTIETR